MTCTNKDRVNYTNGIYFSWVLGISWGILVGWSWPVQLQATVVLALCSAVVREVLKNNRLLSVDFNYLLLLGILNSCGFTLISNHRLQALNWAAGVFIIALGLVRVNPSRPGPRSALEFVERTLDLSVNSFAANLFSLSNLKKLFGWAQRANVLKTNSGKTMAGLIALVMALIINAFLSKINDDYLWFVNNIVEVVRNFFEWLYELGIIETASSSTLVAFVSFCLLQPVSRTNDVEMKQTGSISKYLFMIILPSTVLLVLFSIFQIKWLAINPSLLTYKELSNYVHKGFWELLFVSAICGAVWYFAERTHSQQEAPKRAVFWLLTVFTSSLILLAIFSLHKLTVQQILFGLRDERILATAGVFLLLGSFIGFLLILFKRLGHQTLFFSQSFGLVCVAIVLSFGNVDWFITVVHPLKFPEQEKLHLDYAYLLTNSYDNSGEWLGLMSTAKETGMPMAQDYYWGEYKPLCNYMHGSAYNYPQVYLRDRLRALFDKYEPGSSSDLRHYLQFNLREYLTYQLFRDHLQTFKDFFMFAEDECAEK